VPLHKAAIGSVQVCVRQLAVDRKRTACTLDPTFAGAWSRGIDPRSVRSMCKVDYCRMPSIRYYLLHGSESEMSHEP
jgi:hypothetical protein